MRNTLEQDVLAEIHDIVYDVPARRTSPQKIALIKDILEDYNGVKNETDDQCNCTD